MNNTDRELFGKMIEKLEEIATAVSDGGSTTAKAEAPDRPARRTSKAKGRSRKVKTTRKSRGRTKGKSSDKSAKRTVKPLDDEKLYELDLDPLPTIVEYNENSWLILTHEKPSDEDRLAMTKMTMRWNGALQGWICSRRRLPVEHLEVIFGELDVISREEYDAEYAG